MADKRTVVDLSIEVPATPEQVWEAIATGPGISAWLIPAEVDGRDGGTVSMFHGAGDDPAMNSVSKITVWDPPRALVYEDEWGDTESGAEGTEASDGAASGASVESRLATEFYVEARDGGGCVVRLVCNLFGGTEGWEDEFEGMKTGWVGYLAILRLYLTHFPGMVCSSIYVTGSAAPPKERAQAALTAGLGLAGARVGEHVAATVPAAPPLTGHVEKMGAEEMTVLLDGGAPAPGILLVYVFAMGEHVVTGVHAYLYGEKGRAVAERDAPVWKAWMESRFPAAA